MNKLLILSCSRRKSSKALMLPAIERYDGSAFRVLRKFLRNCPVCANNLDVCILSAEYGLILPEQLIPIYDCKMTIERAQLLNSSVLESLQNVLDRKHYHELFICAGKVYLHSINGYEPLISPKQRVWIAKGGFGKQLTELYKWLYGRVPSSTENYAASSTRKIPCIRGIEISITAQQVINIAREAIAKHEAAALRCQAWYVPVDTHYVSPKWLVSEITGLSVNKFGTAEARKILSQLGIKVNCL